MSQNSFHHQSYEFPSAVKNSDMNIMTVAIKIVPYIIVIPIMETKYLNNKKWLIYRAEHSLLHFQ